MTGSRNATTDREQLDDLREQRDSLRAEATNYRAELERAQRLIGDALLAPDIAEGNDAFPTEDGWPSYEDLIDLWGTLIDVERKIGELEGKHEA